MKITLKHKIYALAAVGLGCFATYGMSSGVQRLTEELSPQAETAAPAAPGKSSTAGGAWIGSRLAALAPTQQSTRDAFAFPAAWLGKSTAADAPASFATTHKLTATFVSNNAASALVNGKLVRIGQTIDGMKLSAVRSRSAHFENDASSIDLAMAQ